MEHAQPLPAPFPWRALAVVALGVALIELVVLLAIALVHVAPRAPAAARTVSAQVTHHPRAAVVHRAPAIPSVPLRPRSHVRVLVLNGNGVGGAAAAQAARLQSEGYRIGGATDAQSHNYAHSVVMFVPGWDKEARRLGRDAGIRIVAPLDGLRPVQLRGSKVVLLLGK